MNRTSISVILRPIFLLLIGIFFFAQASQAQKLIASTDAKEVLVRNTFEIRYEFPDHLDNSFRPPAFKGLQVLDGPNRGSETRISNGRKSVKSTFAYTLTGLNAGKHTIRPASVNYKGKKIFSNSLTVNVVAPNNQKSTNTKDIFIETIVLDTPAYPGSQVNVNYILYTSENLADLSLQKEDEFQSFIVRKLSNDANGTYEVVNGKQYLSTGIRHIALYPTEAGRVKVEPLIINVDVPMTTQRKGRRSLVEQFFSTTRYKTKTIQSEGFSIRTNSFPKPIPNNFSGATGQLEMETTISEKTISTDDAVSLKIQLTGTSNPTAIKAPILDLPNNLTAFPAKIIQDTIKEKNGKLAFSKTFEYLIQPDKAGDYSFQIRTSYFDLGSRSFKEIKSQRIQLTVNQGSITNEDKESNTELTANYMPFIWGILGLLIVLFGIFAWRRSHKDIYQKEPLSKDSKNPEPLQSEKIQAPATTVSPVPVAKKNHFEIDSSFTGKQYLQEVLNETILFFEDKLQMPHAQFQKDHVFKQLESKGNSPQTIHELKDWWTKIESSIYANMPLPYAESKVLDEIKRIVKNLHF